MKFSESLSTGQIVSLSALETTFVGKVMCPTGDREENRECLPLNLQKFKPQILSIITFNFVIILT